MRSAQSFISMKAKRQRIAALTAYDASFAKLVAMAGVDTILIGDSLGMVIQGSPRTQGVTLDEIIYHLRCVRRGAPEVHVMADLPFGCYENGAEQAFTNSARLLAAGAHMVKIEGGLWLAPTIAHLVERGIPVCGHVGLQPQSSLASGLKVQGKGKEAAKRIMQDAVAISEAGASLMVLEMIPASLAREITDSISAATIGIGAGRDCDGQILVSYDVMGVYPNPPSFSRDFLAQGGSIAKALGDYVNAVKKGKFPADANIPA